MDRPRKPHLRAGQRRAAIFVCVALAATLGYAPLKAGAVAALHVGARAGYALTRGAPGLESESLRRQTAAGADWLEAMSTPPEADTASSHSGGLFQPAYTPADDLRPERWREWRFVDGVTGAAFRESLTLVGDADRNRPR